MDVAPSKNCTVPVAVLGETVAVNVTDAPKLEGFALDVIVVAVLPDGTVSVVEPVMMPTVAEMLAVPDATPVARPVALPTVATLVALELQLAVVVTDLVLLSLYVAVAVNCWLLPAATVGFTGVTAMDVIPVAPVPVKEKFCGLPPPSSVIVRNAVAAPNAVGVNVIPITQFPPAATCNPQVLD